MAPHRNAKNVSCGIPVRYFIPTTTVMAFVFFVSWQNHQFEHMSAAQLSTASTGRRLQAQHNMAPLLRSSQTSLLSRSRSQKNKWSVSNPIGIPEGRAQNLPPIQVDSTETDETRKKYGKLVYGGNGDGLHLGGFTDFDTSGVSPATWRGMIQELSIHSVMDIGCGRGISTSWFADHGVKALCVEGSSDAKQQSVLDDPETQVVQHDYSRGPWWPEDTYDAVWSVEFLEHVGLNHQLNYISTFRKAALIFVSSSRWGGWHHVEVHEDDWWKLKFESYGFRFSDELTKQVRAWARREVRVGEELGPTGKKYNAQHIWLSMKVFVNPVVAALPEHAHLFSNCGCFKKLYDPEKPCDLLRREQYEERKIVSPIKLTSDMDEKWMERIRQKLESEQ